MAHSIQNVCEVLSVVGCEISSVSLYQGRPGCGSVTLPNGVEISIIVDGYRRGDLAYEVAVFSGYVMLDAQLINRLDLDGNIIDTVAGYHTLTDVVELVQKCARIPEHVLLAEFQGEG